MTGRLISFEGGEGAGKTTQLRRLAERLRACGREVIETREPGGSEGAEAVRALLVTGEAGRWGARAEALLVNAARADHVERLIRPALARGAWVLCDRFIDSTLAYQGAGRGLGDEGLRALHHFATEDLWPDLTIILDLPPEQGLARAHARRGGETRFEEAGLAFHAAVREGFTEIAAAEPRRCRMLDAACDPDTIAATVWALVEPLLAERTPAVPATLPGAPDD